MDFYTVAAFALTTGAVGALAGHAAGYARAQRVMARRAARQTQRAALLANAHSIPARDPRKD